MPQKAKARLLYHSISTSDRIGSLDSKGALIYTWLFAHADDQGRYAGGARKIKLEIVPFVEDINIGDVEQALEAMTETKPALIIRYYDDPQLIQIADWWEYQSSLRFKNPSRYPPPDNWKDRVKPAPERERDDNGKFA